MRLRTICVISIILIFALACAVLAADTAAKETAKKAPKVRVLFMVGGPYHDNAAVYTPMKKKLEDTGIYTVNMTKDLDQFKPENIKNYDLVMIYTTRVDFAKDQEKGLVQFVENGGGLVGIHSATDSFRDSDAFWKLVGGRFTKHGSGTFKVNITGKRHSTMKGLSDFDIKDETYCDEFCPQSKVIVLARRDSDSEPAAWVQYYGKGRVFVTGLGHGKEAWENPAFVEMIQNASLWAVGRLNP